MTTPQIGMVVQDKTLGRRYTGRITRISADGRSVYVHWHNTSVVEEWLVTSINILS